jgi:hypothetical protein
MSLPLPLASLPEPLILVSTTGKSDSFCLYSSLRVSAALAADSF